MTTRIVVQQALAVSVFLCLLLPLRAQVRRISVTSNGVQAEGLSVGGCFSRDGRFVVFSSDAPNLVAADPTPTGTDLYLHNLQTGETTLLLAAQSSLTERDCLSSDGRFLVFDTFDALVPEDINALTDVYVYDRQTDALSLVTVTPGGAGTRLGGFSGSISPDGSLVVFGSRAPDIVANDTNGSSDVYVRDLALGQTRVLSVSSGGVLGNGDSSLSSISADGKRVAFQSRATNLVAGDTDDVFDVYVHNLETGETTLESVSSGGVKGLGFSGGSWITDDGRLVVFVSAADNLVANDTNFAQDIFVRDTVGGTTTNVSVTSAGEQVNDDSLFPAISRNGRYVAFTTRATNLGPTTNNRNDIAVHDRMTGQTRLVTPGTGNRNALFPIVSNSGAVIFQSDATNLVPNDTNNNRDVFFVPGAFMLPTDPARVPFEDTGDLFVLDDGCHCVLRVTPQRKVSVQLSSADIQSVTGAGSVSLDNRGIAIDADANLYFGEREVGGVLRQTTDGVLTVLAAAAAFQAARGGPADPEPLVFGSDGLLYSVDDDGGTVYRIHPGTGAVAVLAVAADFLAQLGPGDQLELQEILMADGKGLLYVASDAAPPAVFSIATATGQVTLLTSGAPLIQPEETSARASNGNLIIGDRGNGGGEPLRYRQVDSITGESSVFLTQEQIELITNETTEIQGGIAFDSGVNFYLADGGPDHLIRINCVNGEGEIWVSAETIEDVTGVAPELLGEIAFAPADRGPGPFVPAIPSDPETRNARTDTNANQMPDAQDDTLMLERRDNVLSGYELGRPDRALQCILSNQNPLTGWLQTCTISTPVTPEIANLLAPSPKAIWRNILDVLLLVGLPRTLENTITIDSYDEQLRPTSVKVISTLGNFSVESRAQVVDDDGDGLADAVELDSPLPLPFDRVELERLDTDGDGTDDYLSFVYHKDGLRLFLPLADTNGDGKPDTPALDLDGDGKPDPGSLLGPFMAGPANPTTELKLRFAQFGDGVSGGLFLFSEITLFNLDTENAATVKVLLKDGDGNPLTVDLNGEEVVGEKDVVIGPGSVVILRTDGIGSLVNGSVTVCADRAVGGVILFGGTAGLAGVGVSHLQTNGFVASVERRTAKEVNTGIAMMNPTAAAANYTLQLCDRDGKVLATAALGLAAMGHRAFFVDQVEWNVAVDLSDFEGLIKLKSTTPVAATVIQTRPGEFATLPVAANFNRGDNGVAEPVNIRAGHNAQAVPLLNQKQYFAQFADGNGLFSQLILFNLTNREANVKLILKNDDGEPLSVDLNGEVVTGEKSLVIPAGGLRVLSTDGLGDQLIGSVTVCSDRALAGVILFAGGAGVAGVGSSAVLDRGFVAPMQRRVAEGLDTGIAVMNLEEDEEVALDLELFNTEQKLLATARITLAGMGHRAIFVTQVDWQVEEGVELDFTDFAGLLVVKADGQTAATVVQTRTGLFATQPVVPLLN